jgi:hypothetical protein
VTRTVSVTEAGALYDCEAKHAFAYTGHLTDGAALRPKTAPVTLRRGKAWGAGVAAWHATGDLIAASSSASLSLEEDAHQQKLAGVYVKEEHDALSSETLALLLHYTETATRIPLFGLETRLRIPLPSRSGRRSSNRYAFEGYVDGFTRDYDLPGLWIVEFKLRGTFTAFEQAVRSRQLRWYAWAAQRTLGQRVEGVVLDERLKQTPKAPQTLKNGKPSHRKDQLCTADDYRQVCHRCGEPVDAATFEQLSARQWQRRYAVLLRDDEITRAEREIVSAGRAIAEMDAGSRFPVANPSALRCPGCAFRDVCANPRDQELIDLQFDRVAPKRLRGLDAQPAVSGVAA